MHSGVTRRAVTATLAALAALSPDAAPALGPGAVPAEAATVDVPLSLCGGAYCAGYTLDGQRFRAVVDTGSPFLLVDGTCGAPTAGSGGGSFWGCYRGPGRTTGLADTTELFGGQDVGTQWRRGAFAFAAGTSEPSSDEGAWRPAASFLTSDDATFGLVRDYVGKGGGGAVFLGLAKRRLPRIRPTLLEQTQVRAMRFDFLRRTLSLSTNALVPASADAVRLVDLRPRGAPVAAPAGRVRRLVLNGEAVALDRPLIAVIDTGTTGMSISSGLFDSGLLPPSIRTARIDLVAESGGVVTIESSVRKRRPPQPGVPSLEQLGLDTSAPEFDEFPLIISPVDVPWFDPGFGAEGWAPDDERPPDDDALPAPAASLVHRRRRAAPSLSALLARRDGLGGAPHVLFVGLSFLWQRQLTIDVDDGRMTII